MQRPRLDLVFLIDATGSMGDEIAKLKALDAGDVVADLAPARRPTSATDLVACRDRGDVPPHPAHDFTDDLAAFQSVLARVQAGGGGDMPGARRSAARDRAPA